MTPHRKHPRFDSSDPLLDALIAAELDLHRFTAVELEPALRGFLENWSRRQPGAVVRIITGKGKSSPGAPVLLPKMRTLLKGALAAYVRDWTLSEDGGGYIVKLR